jgi:hypothetical protein
VGTPFLFTMGFLSSSFLGFLFRVFHFFLLSCLQSFSFYFMSDTMYMQHCIVFVVIIIIVNTKDLFNVNELEKRVGQSMD